MHLAFVDLTAFALHSAISADNRKLNTARAKRGMIVLRTTCASFRSTANKRLLIFIYLSVLRSTLTLLTLLSFIIKIASIDSSSIH